MHARGLSPLRLTAAIKLESFVLRDFPLCNKANFEFVEANWESWRRFLSFFALFFNRIKVNWMCYTCVSSSFRKFLLRLTTWFTFKYGCGRGRLTKELDLIAIQLTRNFRDCPTVSLVRKFFIESAACAFSFPRHQFALKTRLKFLISHNPRGNTVITLKSKSVSHI
jgi:hypothetical protein